MASVGMQSFVHRRNGQASNVPTSPLAMESRRDRQQLAQSARVSKEDLKAAKQSSNVPQHMTSDNKGPPSRKPTYNNGNHGGTQAESQRRSFNGDTIYVSETQSQDRRSPSLSDTTQDEQQISNPRTSHVDPRFQPNPHANTQGIDATAWYEAAHNTYQSRKIPKSHVNVVEDTQFDSQYPSTTDGAGSEVVQHAQEADSGDAFGHDDDDDDDDEASSNDSGEDDEEDDGRNEAIAFVTNPDHLTHRIFNNDNRFPPTRDSHQQRPLQHHDSQHEIPQLSYLHQRPLRATGHHSTDAQVHKPVSYHQHSASHPAQQRTSRSPAPSTKSAADLTDVLRTHTGSHLPSPSSLTKPKLSAGSEGQGGEANQAQTDMCSVSYPLEAGNTPAPTTRRSRRKRTSSASLDYDAQSLFTMDFRALAKEEFDHIPRGSVSSFPQSTLPGTLYDQFAHVATLERGDQQTYFASLAKADWEQAGDWFVKQYDHLMREMRKKRGEKRRLAREFEEEVSHRHEAVRGEKQCLETSLKKMKSSGSTILAFGTPKGKAP